VSSATSAVPVLYRDIGLDRKEKVNAFLQIGERSEPLRLTKSLSLSLAYDDHPAGFSRPSAGFTGSDFTRGSSWHRKHSDAIVLVIRECGLEKFLTFTRCFPRYKTFGLSHSGAYRLTCL
jgi:hypothetical protein